MRIAVIAAEDRDKEHVLSTCASHADFDGRIAYFAEKDPRDREYKGFPVRPLSELSNESCDMVLVAIRWNHKLSQTLAFLREKSISKVHMVRLYAMDTRADFISNGRLDPQHVDKFPDPTEKPYLVHLEAHVCDHCNLNCKACNNFSPFVTEPAYADPVQYELDLRKLSGLFSKIGRFFLLGGEPLLAPDLTCRMIKLTRKYFPNSELRLLTNGLLIPKMDQSFWAVMRENSVIVHISAYPPTQKMLQQIEEILDREQIHWIVAREVKTFVKRWTDAPLEDARKNNDRCGSAGCHYLRDGILSKCPDAALIKNFDLRFGTRLESRDSLRLDEIEDGYRAMESLDRPIDLCAYCTHDRLEAIDWEPVGAGPEKAHWLVENRLEYERKEWARQRQATADKEEKLAARCQDAERKNGELAAQIETLTAELRDSTVRRQGAERKNSEFAAQMETLRAELSDSTARCHDTERKNSELAAQAEALRTELSDSIAQLKASKEREDVLSAELDDNRRKLDKTRSSENNWRRQCDAARRELQGIKSRLAETEGHYRAMQNSLSFKFGRAVTWLPRKGRDCVCCLKAKGIKQSIKEFANRVIEKVLPDSALKLNQLFQDRMLAGYNVYSKIIEEHGHDVTILGNAIKGTGDYYICGQYLKGWLEKHRITNYVFLTLSGSQQAVTRLFDVYDQHTYVLSFYHSLLLRDFRGFAGTENQNFVFLDHQNPFPSNRSHNINTSSFMGFKGLNIHDFYLYYGFGLSETAPKEDPQFSENTERLKKLFSDPNFKRGKTVLLSPYSESNTGEYQLPNFFWENLVKKLHGMGYYVYTNCAGKEKEITGTTPLFLPYMQSVPFLNEAGLFIGFRSGLCDIVATSTCKKIILHARQTRFWPEGASIAYTGLNNMGLCNHAIELEISNENASEILEQIVQEVLKE